MPWGIAQASGAPMLRAKKVFWLGYMLLHHSGISHNRSFLKKVVPQASNSRNIDGFNPDFGVYSRRQKQILIWLNQKLRFAGANQ
jgi:hypothetical protein